MEPRPDRQPNPCWRLLAIGLDRRASPSLAGALRAALEPYDLVPVDDAAAALRALAADAVDCVVLSGRLRDVGGCTGEIRSRHPDVPVVVVDDACALRGVLNAVREALGRQHVERSLAGASRDGRDRLPDGPALSPQARERFRGVGLVWRGPVLEAALAVAERAAAAKATVLLHGESGTGKERFAQAIHRLGPRSSRPFTAVNCAALPESLLESELFGWVRGAFTGAERARVGLFEEASGGTLFLDEVSELSLATQAKLLRVLQEQEVRPIGSTRTVRIDVRIIAAANRDLWDATRSGAFRVDLFYRLNVIPIRLPPLRERPEDVACLAQDFLHQLASEGAGAPPGFEPETLRLFERYEWPGNVRELHNEIQRLAVLAAPGRRIPPSALAERILRGAADGPGSPPETPLKTIVRQVETATILHRLRQHGYNRRATARSLGISREALWAKMRQLGLEPPRMRRGELDLPVP
ncbi:MAG: sigma 54-interacting transcriptional regulator [Thermodesulfobacteriota bacterium]